MTPGQNRIGPSLSGVNGRKAGSVEGARELSITWDAPQIDTFLANPRAMVKGSTMTISVTSAADRAPLTAYHSRPCRPDRNEIWLWHRLQGTELDPVTIVNPGRFSA